MITLHLLWVAAIIVIFAALDDYNKARKIEAETKRLRESLERLYSDTDD